MEAWRPENLFRSRRADSEGRTTVRNDPSSDLGLRIAPANGLSRAAQVAYNVAYIVTPDNPVASPEKQAQLR